MKKIYNYVASEYELPQSTPQSRYLKCEALTGEWWYKDMQTGEDLPLFTQPINWQHNDTLTFNQEKVFNEFVENVVEPTIKFKELQDRIDKAIEYSNNCLENLKDQDEYMCESIDIVSLLQMIHKNYLDILQGSDKE